MDKQKQELLVNLITEELSRNEISSMITSKLESELSSREFKKAVKELASDVVNELFKILWQRNSVWKTSVTN